MAETAWTAKTRKKARAYFKGFQSMDELDERWRVWDELSENVGMFFSLKNLQELPAEKVYSGLIALFNDRPRIRGRFKALVGFQDGGRLKDALLRLIKSKEHGDPGRRIRAMKLGGIGRATASEILCLWWPYRFFPQNGATCSALSKLVEVYRKRDLQELPYDAFMDLVGSLECVFREEATALWPEIAEQIKLSRFVYFYSFITEP